MNADEMNGLTERIRDSMLAHDLVEARAERLTIPTVATRPRRRPRPSLGRSGVIAAACSLLVIAGIIAVLAIHHDTSGVPAGPAARPTTSSHATAASALTCPPVPAASQSAQSGPYLGDVPSLPIGFDGSTRLVPLTTPAHVFICADIGPRNPIGQSGSVELSGDLSGVAADLAWMPPSPRQGTNCAAITGTIESEASYLIGLSYPGATVWISAGGGRCGGSSSNGQFKSDADTQSLAQNAYLSGHWVSAATVLHQAKPPIQDPCQQVPTGRLGQEKAMVPAGAVRVQACGPHGVSPVEPAAAHQDLVAALNAQPVRADSAGCQESSAAQVRYEVRFDYAVGPSVLVDVVPNCNADGWISNNALVSAGTAAVLPQVLALLNQR